MASTMDAEIGCVMIVLGITEKSWNLIAKDTIDCDGLDDVLVGFVKGEALELFVTGGF